MADFSITDLITAPILAVNEAEAKNALQFVEHLQEHLFEPDEQGNSPSPSLKTLNFVFDRMDQQGRLEKYEVSLPMMQFVPFGGVAIDRAVLKYNLHVQAE